MKYLYDYLGIDLNWLYDLFGEVLEVLYVDLCVDSLDMEV